MLGGSVLGWGGESQGVDGGEEGVYNGEQIHFDRIWCATRRFEECCVERVVELFVGNPARVSLILYTRETNNYLAYFILDGKESE